MSCIGKILGNRYEIIKKIGNGGMATVYKATDMILKRPVAVKILRDEFTTDEEFINWFRSKRSRTWFICCFCPRRYIRCW